MKLDQTDRKILDILQSDGRITNAKLAADIGISPPGMLERVKRLENTGVIQRYVALLDREKVGKGIMAIVSVSLTVHQLTSVDGFKEEIDKLDEILDCFHITGEDDFVLKVAVDNIKEYENFILHKISQIPGVNKIRTSFVLSTVKYETKVTINENGGNKNGSNG